MKWSQIENGWTKYAISARAQWSKLSEEQISGTLGKREALSAWVQEAYGISEAESQQQISAWLSRQLEAQPVQAAR